MEISQKRKRYARDAPSDDILTLIQLVRQNPALYNYKLQPNQRRRIDVLNGWSNIAAQIGNKYTVEECRRKWKNLRDTYHQYRLRKPKVGDGLSKWRYAKELEFLSTVYQPKLKMHRQPQQTQYDTTSTTTSTSCTNSNLHGNDDMVHSTIHLVNDDAETFILTTYEDGQEDPNIHMELHDVVEDDEDQMQEQHHTDVHIVKNEIHEVCTPDDGATGAEVDYEEVCLYEEAGNTQNGCETVIGGSGLTRSSSSDSKAFQYLDANDFCIGLPKLKNVTVVSSANVVTTVNTMSHTSHSNNNSHPLNSNSVAQNLHNPNNNSVDTVSTIASAIMQYPVAQQQQPQPPPPAPVSTQNAQQPTCSSSSSGDCVQTCEELDLFFDFLKKKLQSFSKSEITAIQVEFLNCVLRREADKNGQ